MRILVVDDQRMFGELLSAALDSTEDMEVVGLARTSAQATRAALDLKPDIVLMDYRLPDRNGILGAEEILEALPETKIIMVTAIQDDAIILAAIQKGCAAVITKDKGIHELEAIIRAVASGEPAIGPELVSRLAAYTLRDVAARRRRSDLTPRESEVLTLTAEGLTNPEIARRLEISVKTVGNHIHNILTKLHARSKLEAVAIATRRGLVAIR